MNDRECSRTSTNVWRSLCDHCELLANCNRKPIRHTFATGDTSITFDTPQNDRECLRTATNVWRSFAIIAKSWRTAFVSPFAIYSPQCETSIRTIQPNRDKNKIQMYLPDGSTNERSLPNHRKQTTGGDELRFGPAPIRWIVFNKIDKIGSKIGYDMSLIVVEAIRGRCASFMILRAMVSEIFGRQTNSTILVVGAYR